MASPGIRTFVISMHADEKRRKALLPILNQTPRLNVTLFEGCSVLNLPETAAVALTGSDEWAHRRGELGCFLSHVGVWEKVSREGGDYCLVLEDDAVLIDIGRLHDLAIPIDADLVFLNDRMATYDQLSAFAPICLPLRRALPRIRARDGVGTDGYLIRPRGAKMLLKAVLKDRMYGHVDLRLFAYSLNPDELGVLSHHNRELYSLVSPLPQCGAKIINSYCVSRPITRHGSFRSSRRQVNATYGWPAG